MRIVFAGSPDAAVPSLQALIASEHDVVGVITRPDTPQGRKRVLTRTPVASVAEAAGIPVMRARRLDQTVTDQVAALRPDLGVIVAYGGLVREPLLSHPQHGWINLHFSILPRWRGAAPVQHSIIAGDDVTGATVFSLVDELDAGAVLGMMTQPIGAHQTAGALLDSLAGSGAELLVRVVDAIATHTAVPRPQEGDVTFAPKLTLADGWLDFSADDRVLYARIRGVTPEPGAFGEIDGARVKVHEAAPARDALAIAPGEVHMVGQRVLVGTGREPLELVTVQPAGKPRMRALDWMRGRQGRPTAFSVRGSEQ